MSGENRPKRRLSKREMEERRRRKLKKLKIRRAIILGVMAAILVLIILGIRGIVKAVASHIEKNRAQETSLDISADSEDMTSGDTGDTKTEDAEEPGGVLDDGFDLAVSADISNPVDITISSVGDCTLGTDETFAYATGFNAYYDSYGADYFLKNVRTVFEADDLTIANLEGTFTTSTSRADKQFAFKADPSWVSILTGSSVEAVNVANNHSHDYGEESFEDTLTTLEDAGITYFGYEDMAIEEVEGVKIGLTGIYELAEGAQKAEQVKENIAYLKEQGAQIIVVNFHWGIERDTVPNETQIMLARLAIDEGADLVIGHHPHVLQGIEVYNGKYICYSLGNFCFGGNKNPSDKDTMIFQQTFHISMDGTLEPVSEEDINIIPCSVSSASDKNTYCPTILEGDEADRVLDKIGQLSDQIPEP